MESRYGVNSKYRNNRYHDALVVDYRAIVEDVCISVEGMKYGGDQGAAE